MSTKLIARLPDYNYSFEPTLEIPLWNGGTKVFTLDGVSPELVQKLAATEELFTVCKAMLSAIQESGLGYSHFPSLLRQEARAAIAKAEKK